jgi:heme-degrading monooxygenase HmoA
MSIISVTRLHLRSPRFVPEFFWYTYKARHQAGTNSGNVGVSIRKTKELAFWTLSLWPDIEAMKSFVITSPHKEAMQKLAHWCDEAAFADWQQDTNDPPSWDRAAETLRTSGRLLPLLHPTEQHKAGKIVTT